MRTSEPTKRRQPSWVGAPTPAPKEDPIILVIADFVAPPGWKGAPRPQQRSVPRVERDPDGTYGFTCPCSAEGFSQPKPIKTCPSCGRKVDVPA